MVPMNKLQRKLEMADDLLLEICREVKGSRAATVRNCIKEMQLELDDVMFFLESPKRKKAKKAKGFNHVSNYVQWPAAKD